MYEGYKKVCNQTATDIIEMSGDTLTGIIKHFYGEPVKPDWAMNFLDIGDIPIEKMELILEGNKIGFFVFRDGVNVLGHNVVMSICLHSEKIVETYVVIRGDAHEYKIALEPIVKKGEKYFTVRPPEEVAKETTRKAVISWLGIQTALQNPVVKEMLSTSAEIKAKCAHAKNKHSKKRKIVYVRHHKIGDGDIGRLLSTNRDFERHTDCWSVIGHWREYKSGKRVFVKPYLKGPKRKEGNVETRERGVSFVAE